MSNSVRKPEQISYLDKNDNIQTVTEFTVTTLGIIFEVGAASEVFIPWHRVLEYMGPRNGWLGGDHAPNAR